MYNNVSYLKKEVQIPHNHGGHFEDEVEDEREIEVINGWVYRHINP